jgi:hypothetical protein
MGLPNSSEPKMAGHPKQLAMCGLDGFKNARDLRPSAMARAACESYDHHAEVDDVDGRTTPNTDNPVDELAERGHQDRPMRAERRIPRIGRSDPVEPGRLADDLRGELAVRSQVDRPADLLVEGALGDQQSGHRLPAIGVLLDHQVPVVATAEPLVEHLALSWHRYGKAADMSRGPSNGSLLASPTLLQFSGISLHRLPTT